MLGEHDKHKKYEKKVSSERGGNSPPPDHMLLGVPDYKAYRDRMCKKRKKHDDSDESNLKGNESKRLENVGNRSYRGLYGHSILLTSDTRTLEMKKKIKDAIARYNEYKDDKEYKGMLDVHHILPKYMINSIVLEINKEQQQRLQQALGLPDYANLSEVEKQAVEEAAKNGIWWSKPDTDRQTLLEKVNLYQQLCSLSSIVFLGPPQAMCTGGRHHNKGDLTFVKDAERGREVLDIRSILYHTIENFVLARGLRISEELSGQSELSSQKFGEKRADRLDEPRLEAPFVSDNQRFQAMSPQNIEMIQGKFTDEEINIIHYCFIAAEKCNDDLNGKEKIDEELVRWIYAQDNEEYYKKKAKKVNGYVFDRMQAMVMRLPDIDKIVPIFRSRPEHLADMFCALGGQFDLLTERAIAERGKQIPEKQIPGKLSGGLTKEQAKEVKGAILKKFELSDKSLKNREKYIKGVIQEDFTENELKTHINAYIDSLTTKNDYKGTLYEQYASEFCIQRGCKFSVATEMQFRDRGGWSEVDIDQFADAILRQFELLPDNKRESMMGEASKRLGKKIKDLDGLRKCRFHRDQTLSQLILTGNK